MNIEVFMTHTHTHHLEAGESNQWFPVAFPNQQSMDQSLLFWGPRWTKVAGRTWPSSLAVGDVKLHWVWGVPMGTIFSDKSQIIFSITTYQVWSLWVANYKFLFWILLSFLPVFWKLLLIAPILEQTVMDHALVCQGVGLNASVVRVFQGTFCTCDAVMEWEFPLWLGIKPTINGDLMGCNWSFHIFPISDLGLSENDRKWVCIHPDHQPSIFRVAQCPETPNMAGNSYWDFVFFGSISNPKTLKLEQCGFPSGFEAHSAPRLKRGTAEGGQWLHNLGLSYLGAQIPWRSWNLSAFLGWDLWSLTKSAYFRRPSPGCHRIVAHLSTSRKKRGGRRFNPAEDLQEMGRWQEFPGWAGRSQQGESNICCHVDVETIYENI